MTTIITSNNVHRMLLDNGSIIDIIYLDAYKRMGLDEHDLSPTTSSLYGFTGDHFILRVTIKLAITVGEHPRVSTVITNFLIVDCLSTFNGVLGRPLLKVLKVVTSIYHLTMKFLTAKGTRQVKGIQYNSREYYNKSLKLAKREKRLLQIIEVGASSTGPMETNIDPCLQDDESIAGLVKELVEVLLDLSEPSHVLRIG